MRYILTKHAKARMGERSISKKLIEGALHNPTRVSYDSTGKMLLKKLYTKRGKEYLLVIVCDQYREELRIITIIETSKVKKYL